MGTSVLLWAMIEKAMQTAMRVYASSRDAKAVFDSGETAARTARAENAASRG
ncbi:hypothetical protein ACFWTC_37980 [Streptomyces sp. NPDC058619]|uniref:hypothetical protein n=1 Tax=unclassified Streptomyces TaxID=2593676 RepID=UPI00364A693E